LKKPEVTVKEISVMKNPTRATNDDGRVRIGLTTPLFPPVRREPENIGDDGKVRMGLTTPLFPPVRREPQNVADDGKVRMGLTSPLFPPIRSR
jgi:hypothetical protein